MVSYRAPLLMTGISTREMFGVWASVLPSVCLWALTWTRPYSCTLCESAVGPEKDWHLCRGPYAPASALQGNSSMGLQQMRKGYGGHAFQCTHGQRGQKTFPVRGTLPSPGQGREAARWAPVFQGQEGSNPILEPFGHPPSPHGANQEQRSPPSPEH